MHRRLLLVPLAGLLAACSASVAPPPGASQATSAQAAPSSTVTYVVQDYSFPSLVVAPGQVVRVIDRDPEPHTVTADGGAFDTGSVDSTTPGSFTAPKAPGRYPFSCRVHPTMHGILVVR